MKALQVEHVSKYYKDFPALNDVTFSIEHGSFVGLLGLNGAGKTSLISSIASITTFSGCIKVMNYDNKLYSTKSKKHLGVVPQELSFDPFLTVAQTLEFQAGLYGIKEKKWLDELIVRMHLEKKVNSVVQTLSGGMQRRLMLARALVHRPNLIVLDEPTVGVDVTVKKSIWELINELNKNGHTILLTSHNFEEVETLCSDIIILNDGKIISHKSKQELVQNSQKFSCMVEIEYIDSNKIKTNCTYHLEHNKDLAKTINKLNLQGFTIENIRVKHYSLEDIFTSYVETD